MMGQGNFF